jgi:hypothetical protein
VSARLGEGAAWVAWGWKGEGTIVVQTGRGAFLRCVLTGRRCICRGRIFGFFIFHVVSALYLNGKKLDLEQFSRRARRLLTDVARPEQEQDNDNADAVADLETLVQQLETQFATQAERLRGLLQQRRGGGGVDSALM